MITAPVGQIEESKALSIEVIGNPTLNELNSPDLVFRGNTVQVTMPLEVKCFLTSSVFRDKLILEAQM